MDEKRGRKPIIKKPEKHTIYLEGDTWAKLEKTAPRIRRSVSEIIRQAVDEWLAKKQNGDSATA